MIRHLLCSAPGSAPQARSRPDTVSEGPTVMRGSYTHCREPHVLDIVKLVDQSLPGATAVPVQITWCGRRAVGPRKTVGDDLVDGLGSPLSRCQGGRTSAQYEEQNL